MATWSWEYRAQTMNRPNCCGPMRDTASLPSASRVPSVSSHAVTRSGTSDVLPPRSSFSMASLMASSFPIPAVEYWVSISASNW